MENWKDESDYISHKCRELYNFGGLGTDSREILVKTNTHRRPE